MAKRRKNGEGSWGSMCITEIGMEMLEYFSPLQLYYFHLIQAILILV